MAFYDGNGKAIVIGSGEKSKERINRLLGYKIPYWNELDGDFSNVVRNTVTEWMTAHAGSPMKIPLIVSTDHHVAQLSGNGQKLFDLIGDITPWDNVSAVANLGDTTEGLNPVYLDIQSKIPAEKQINVWGNHDIEGQYLNRPEEEWDSGMISSSFNTYYPCGRMHGFDRHGNRVIMDDMFKVKYLVISCFEWDKHGVGINYIGTEAMNFIISNMEVNDGYKLVILSHIPLLYDGTGGVRVFGEGEVGVWRNTGAQGNSEYPPLNTDPFFAARKTGGTGAIIDSDGVSHSYDFSGCAEDSPFVCAIAGHMHSDGYCYIGGEVASVSLDKYYYDDTVHFLLIDLENDQINVWKVDNTPQVQNYQIPLTKPAE